MKPPIIDKIRREDLPDAPTWIDKVLLSLNRFMEGVYNLFNKNLTVEDNFDMERKTFTISQTDIDNGYRIKYNLKHIPWGVQLVRLVKDGGSHTVITTAPFVDWTIDNNLLKINGIAGIAATGNYTATIIIM